VTVGIVAGILKDAGAGVVFAELGKSQREARRRPRGRRNRTGSGKRRVRSAAKAALRCPGVASADLSKTAVDDYLRPLALWSVR